MCVGVGQDKYVLKNNCVSFLVLTQQITTNLTTQNNKRKYDLVVLQIRCLVWMWLKSIC